MEGVVEIKRTRGKGGPPEPRQKIGERRLECAEGRNRGTNLSLAIC